MPQTPSLGPSVQKYHILSFEVLVNTVPFSIITDVALRPDTKNRNHACFSLQFSVPLQNLPAFVRLSGSQLYFKIFVQSL
jgi:hypothetical protein